MGEMIIFSGLLYCADCGKKMYLCRCTTMNQKEYFNCSTYRKKKKGLCSSHQITLEAVETAVLNDLQYTLNFATDRKHELLDILIEDTERASKKELSSKTKELDEAEIRVKVLDKIIQKLYEDKVIGELSVERYQKLSATYEDEQQTLSQRITELRNELDRQQEICDDIGKFMKFAEKYNMSRS